MRKAKSDKTAVRTEMMECVLNGINIAVFVTDMSTNEILYVNTELLGMQGDGQLAGRICWKALKERNKRCESCPIIYLLKNPGKSYRRILDVEGKRYQVHDSIIPWVDGRLAHLQYMVDLTEQLHE